MRTWTSACASRSLESADSRCSEFEPLDGPHFRPPCHAPWGPGSWSHPAPLPRSLGPWVMLPSGPPATLLGAPGHAPIRPPCHAPWGPGSWSHPAPLPRSLGPRVMLPSVLSGRDSQLPGQWPGARKDPRKVQQALLRVQALGCTAPLPLPSPTRRVPSCLLPAPRLDMSLEL